MTPTERDQADERRVDAFLHDGHERTLRRGILRTNKEAWNLAIEAAALVVESHRQDRLAAKVRDLARE